jgi:hypothetical protein
MDSNIKRLNEYVIHKFIEQTGKSKKNWMSANDKKDVLIQICAKLGVSKSFSLFTSGFKLEKNSKLNDPENRRQLHALMIFINKTINIKQSYSGQCQEVCNNLTEHTKSIISMINPDLNKEELEKVADDLILLCLHRDLNNNSQELPRNAKQFALFLRAGLNSNFKKSPENLKVRLSNENKTSFLKEAKLSSTGEPPSEVSTLDMKPSLARNNKKVTIIGSGPTGLMTALAISKKFPNITIEIINYQRINNTGRTNNIAFFKYCMNDVDIENSSKIILTEDFQDKHGVSEEKYAQPITSCTIKHLEKQLMKKVKSNPNLAIINIDRKITKEDIEKIEGPVVLAVGANHELAKGLGFTYKKRNFPSLPLDKKASLNASHLNIKLRIPNSSVEEIEKKLKKSKDIFYCYKRVHKSKKNEGFTTFYINKPLIEKNNDSFISHKITTNEEGRNSAIIFLEKMEIGKDYLSEVSSFTIEGEKMEEVCDNKKDLGNRDIYVIGDSKATPFYLNLEGIHNANNDIRDLVNGLKF